MASGWVASGWVASGWVASGRVASGCAYLQRFGCGRYGFVKEVIRKFEDMAFYVLKHFEARHPSHHRLMLRL